MGLVITREEALMAGHCPNSLIHREMETKDISEAIKPLFEGRQPDNLFIFGDPGTGKTAVITQILKGLERKSSRVKLIYVNCWQHSTRMAIYSLIVRALGEMMPRRGLARDEVFDRIIELMEKEGTRILLVLDDVDGLFFHGEAHLLCDIERAGKGKPFFGSICISNNGNLMASKGVGSEVRFSQLEFKHYNLAELEDILEQRAIMGLAPGSWGKEVIEACAEKMAARKSNVRNGLDLLWRAAKNAEKVGRAEITLEDVKATDKCNSFGAVGQLEGHSAIPQVKLSDEEQVIFEIVKTGPKSSTDLYLAFSRKLKRSKRQIRNYLHELEAKKVLNIQTIDGGSPLLNTRMIQLANL
ncbi:MAG: AAA family ATPase [Candidatus Micrarchaeota archaeon]|nr:AAA family ATPase [Candidatus Micrarchaeota archaeon]